MTEENHNDPFEEGDRAFESGQFEESLAQALQFMSSDDPEMKRDAGKLAGLSCFHLKRFDEALGYFSEIAKDGGDAYDWFNVVTSATLGRQIPLAQDAFETFSAHISSVPHQRGGLSLPQGRLFFIHALCDVGAYNEAFEQLEHLRVIHEGLVITDDGFLYMRGVPFLSETIRAGARIFEGLGPSFDQRAWIQTLARKVDEEGQTYLAQVLSPPG